MMYAMLEMLAHLDDLSESFKNAFGLNREATSAVLEEWMQMYRKRHNMTRPDYDRLVELQRDVAALKNRFDAHELIIRELDDKLRTLKIG